MAVKVLDKQQLTSATVMQKPFVAVDPPWAQSLFSSTRWAWLWLITRVYLGYIWFTGGLDKIDNPAWMTGSALKGFWERAIQVPTAPAKPAIAYDWYRAFIQSLLDGQAYVWFSKLVAYGELIVGVALVLGIFTGFAAFFGGFMNWNYMMAGAASINPIMFPLSIFLILAWKVAGYWGFDRWLLPLLGAPWQPGRLFTKNENE
jgi:thiosulfate dehydrogenase [quinone] large subunit